MPTELFQYYTIVYIRIVVPLKKEHACNYIELNTIGCQKYCRKFKWYMYVIKPICLNIEKQGKCRI